MAPGLLTSTLHPSTTNPLAQSQAPAPAPPIQHPVPRPDPCNYRHHLGYAIVLTIKRRAASPWLPWSLASIQCHHHRSITDQYPALAAHGYWPRASRPPPPPTLRLYPSSGPRRQTRRGDSYPPRYQYALSGNFFKKSVRLKFNSHIYKKLQYQIVIWADLSFGTTFSGIGRTVGGMATPAAWSAFPATPRSAVLR